MDARGALRFLSCRDAGADKELVPVGSAFETGDAFGADRDEWTYGGVLGITLVF